MSNEPISGTISALGNLGMGIAGSVMSNREAKRNREMLMNIQREEWRRQDTAVQRRMADLKMAGINPMLAGSQGGAPSGNMLTSLPDSAASMNQANANTMGAISEITNLSQNIPLNKANIEKIAEETNTNRAMQSEIASNVALNQKKGNLTEAETIKTTVDTNLQKANIPLTNAQTNQVIQQTENLKRQYITEGAKLNEINAKISYLTQQTKNAKQQGLNMQSQRKLIDLQADKTKIENNIQQHDLNYLNALAEILGPYAKGFDKNSGEIIKLANGIIGGLLPGGFAKNIFKGFKGFAELFKKRK